MPEVTTHRLPTVRWWMLVGLALSLAVSFQQITQPDYNTERRATPDEWLWVVVPGLCFAGLIAWRMLQSRIETSAAGVRVVRVFSTETIPWEHIAGFEIRPTPNRAGFIVSARHTNMRVTKLGTLPGRSAKRRAQAEQFVAGLAAERARSGAALRS